MTLHRKVLIATLLLLSASLGFSQYNKGGGGGADGPHTGLTRQTQSAAISTSSITGVSTSLGIITSTDNTSYIVRGVIFASSSATANGVGIGVVWPTSDSVTGSCLVEFATSTTAHVWRTMEAPTDAFTVAATSPAPISTLYPNFVTCTFSVTTNTSDSFILTFGGENGAETYILGAGSYIEWETF